jgi:hypothetical protein
MTKVSSKSSRKKSEKTNLQNAIELNAEFGWSLFPCSDTKAPLTKNGLYNASSDPAAIRQRWKNNPNALIGLPCGPGNSVFVIDLDKKKDIDGIANFTKLMNGQKIRTRTVETPSGGRHHYFQYSDDLKDIKNWNGKIAPGIDTKTGGGYVITAPSRLTDGREYKVIDDSPIAEMPSVLRQKLLALASKPQPEPPTGELKSAEDTPWGILMMGRLCGPLAEAKEGTRNDHLFRCSCLAGRLIGGGAVTEKFAVEKLTAAAQQCGPLIAERRRNSCGSSSAGSIIRRPCILAIRSSTMLSGSVTVWPENRSNVCRRKEALGRPETGGRCL